MIAALEIAAFNPKCAVIAALAGANRVELCRNYEVGGLTPSLDDIAFVKESIDVPVFVMVRAHPNGFVFTKDEHVHMQSVARDAIKAGADGIVFGALRKDGRIDEEALRNLVESVAPHPVTFHRAFDEAPDPFEALDALMRCGTARLLTSGGRPTAAEGVELISQLVERAGSDLTVIPGGGIRFHNAKEIIERTGSVEVHSAARTTAAKVDLLEVWRLVDALA